MKQTFTKLGVALFALLFLATGSAKADWKDIKVDLTNKNLVTTEESAAQRTDVNGGDYIGIAIDGAGTASRVAKDDVSAVCQVKGKWHSDQWGWVNHEIIVPVEGTVKITLGDAYTYGSAVTVKNSSKESVVDGLNTYVEGKYYSSGHPENVVSAYYTGPATTLTITGGAYLLYFAIEKVDYIPNYKTATFSIGETGATGVVPASITKDINFETTFTIPSNFTLYKEGYTLTGWNDGVNTYNVGETYTMSENVTFTPVFTANTVSLDDRTEAVSVTWDFQRNNGAPVVAWQNTSGHFWIAQATIDGEVIDVKMDINTNPGKFNNTANTDCTQTNTGTSFTVPSRLGSVLTTQCHGSFSISTTTIDGSSEYASGKGTTTITYNINQASGSSVIVIGDGSYYKYVTVTYPVIAVSPAKEFTTFCSTSPLDFSNVDGLEAYVVTGSTTTTITLAQVTKVPANTGLILKKTGSAASYNVPVGTATSLAETNKLVGVTEATTFTAGDYLLSDGKFVKGTAGTLAAGKAYLPAASVSAGAREMLLDFGGTTGIHQIESAKQRVEGYYNLAGQRVAQPRKGLYIVNGKKVVIK